MRKYTRDEVDPASCYGFAMGPMDGRCRFNKMEPLSRTYRNVFSDHKGSTWSSVSFFSTDNVWYTQFG